VNYYFITGASRGIGKSIALHLLDDSTTHVTGISRSNTWEHPRFSFLSMDLSDTGVVSAFCFPELADADSVGLINNAGLIGDIRHAGNMDSRELCDVFAVNLVAPSLLTNAFINAYRGLSCDKTVLNIGSGAAVNPIDGWSSYCSSKAGLDMFCKVVAKEQELDKGGFRIFSVYPGIVDTAMQDRIRAAEAADFSRVQDFIGFKSNDELLDPDEVAGKIVSVIFKNRSNVGTVFALRDV
jgi:benzil reductase ((S)-benzoin forming)